MVLEPITTGIITAAIYDAAKHGKKFVVPGFRGFIVDCINDTSFEKYPIDEKELFDFFEIFEIKNEIDEFRKKGTEPNLEKFSQILTDNSNITDKELARNFLNDLFKLVEEKIISDPKIHQKISLRYQQKILDEVKKLSSDVSDSSKIQQEILDKLVNRNIEENFDPKKQSINEIISNLEIINSKFHAADSNYKINASLKDNRPTIEVSHKNFKNMDKNGMLFRFKLKLKNQKAQNLQDFFKKGEDSKLKLNPEEIEEFSFSKNNEIVYIVKNPQDISYELKPTPRTLPLHIVIPNSDVHLNYLLFTIEEKEGKIIVNNYQQKDSPILIELKIDMKTRKSRLRVKSNDAQYTLTNAYQYFKFYNAMIKNKKIQIFDPELKKTIQEFSYLEKDEKGINDESLDLINKLVEIGNILDLDFPWPPESFTNEEANDIFLVHDVITTGKSKMGFQSDIKGNKSEKAFQVFAKEIREKGYVQYKMQSEGKRVVTISAFDIDLGTYSTSGKVTTDMRPDEFLKIYDEATDDQELEIPVSSIGSYVAVFPMWDPKNKSKKR